MNRAIADMQRSLVFWLRASYRAQGLAEGIAADANPTTALRAALRKLSTRWQGTFDRLAEKLGADLAEMALTNTDAALNSGLRGEGFTVKFTMSDPMRTAYNAVVGEQVALIKSIASEHLSDVEGLVMRSVARGRDLGSLTKDLEKRYSLTRKRAALIARDQNNKATSVLQATRQQQLGITDGIWKHSHGGKHPRPSHVAADGKRFTLSEGLLVDGEYIMPGQLINCRCGWKAVIPGLE